MLTLQTGDRFARHHDVGRFRVTSHIVCGGGGASVEQGHETFTDRSVGRDEAGPPQDGCSTRCTTINPVGAVRTRLCLPSCQPIKHQRTTYLMTTEQHCARHCRSSSLRFSARLLTFPAAQAPTLELLYRTVLVHTHTSYISFFLPRNRRLGRRAKCCSPSPITYHAHPASRVGGTLYIHP